ncbi:MAG: carboxylesterase family protein [Eubacteriaceae bacterium]|nr:carboxylesterase family protein [Eubacteriaceae bacterium]
MIYIAKTESGLVRGLTAGDTFITVFKGIPFAAPASGKNRWRVPQPVEKWDGIKDCFEFGPAAYQTVKTGEGFYDKEWHNNPEWVMSEDCLQLNIWTPAKDPGEKLPVMVWIYGGGLQEGYPGEMEFDGERIAKRGVVLVSVNYRVNVFGWLAHPEITAECGGKDCTNFGLYDQKAGIEWVYRNIAAFGGDPENITIFGQSAGGRSVMSQVVSPKNNDGHIKRAISQSSTPLNFGFGHGNDYPTLPEAEEMGKKFFEFIGAKNLEEARSMPAEFIRDKGAEFSAKRMGSWQFTVDGSFLPGEPVALLNEGKYIDIPMMCGSTTGEFFDLINAKDMAGLEKTARSLYGEYADEFLKIIEFDKNDFERSMALCKVNGSAFSARLFAMRSADLGRTTYLYQFDPEIPGDDHPGVFHSSDLWFVFETLGKCWRPFKGKHYDLARLVCNYWTNFAKTGDPNGKDADGKAMPVWIPFTDDSSHLMVFEDTAHMGDEKDMSPSVREMYRLAADKMWRK